MPKTSDAPKINALANQIKKLLNLIHIGGQFYHYCSGVYLLVEEKELQRVIKEKLGGESSRHKIREVETALAIEAFVPERELNADLKHINFTNGLLRLEDLELLPHDPKVITTTQIPVAFDPQAQCPGWKKFLQESLGDDLGKIGVLQEFLGLLLIPDMQYEKALILFGEGANGKDVIGDVVKSILGKANYSTISFEHLGDRFRTAEIFGKLANFSSEISSKAVAQDGLLKEIISGNEITVERKYSPPFSCRPTARLISATNQLPKVFDQSHGFYRKFLIIPFNKIFGEDEQDKTLKHRLVAEERQGITLWKVEGLIRLRKRGYFEQSPQMREAIGEFRSENNDVMQFVEQLCYLKPDAEVDKQTLHGNYSSWCVRHKLPPAGKNRFGRMFGSAYASQGVQDGKTAKGVRCWRGIAMLDRLDTAS